MLESIIIYHEAEGVETAWEVAFNYYPGSEADLDRYGRETECATGDEIEIVGVFLDGEGEDQHEAFEDDYLVDLVWAGEGDDWSAEDLANPEPEFFNEF